ncbi:MAG: hypothetical protein ACLSDM_04735 [Butyricicoccus sp.]
MRCRAIRGEWQSAFWRQPARSVLCWAARRFIARIMAPRIGGAAVADAISHTFGFAAYAADTGELRQPKDSKIVFDTGNGADDPEKVYPAVCSR